MPAVVEAEGDDDRQEQHAETSYHDDKLWAVHARPIVDVSCPGAAIRLALVIQSGASRKGLRLAAAQIPPAIHRAVIFPLSGAFIDSALGRAADHAGQDIINFPFITVRGTAAEECLHARRLIHRDEHVYAAVCADGEPSQ